MRGQVRHIPESEEIICSKCGKVIEPGDGRRYRMKYRHFHCLPPTRLKQIINGETEADRTRKKVIG